jgi:hypothetical protein
MPGLADDVVLVTGPRSWTGGKVSHRSVQEREATKVLDAALRDEITGAL